MSSAAAPPPLRWVRMRAAGASHEGPRRMYNEDSFGIFLDAPASLAIVADGMGGSSSGRDAADLVVEAAKHAFDTRAKIMLEESVSGWWLGEHGESSKLPPEDRADVVQHVTALLRHRKPESMGDVAALEAERRALFDIPRRAIASANTQVLYRSRTSPMWRGSGSTAFCALFADDHASLAWVGDSRISRLRHADGVLEALTIEHTLRNEYLKVYPRKLTEEELNQIPGNVIVRAVGMKDDLLIDTRVVPINKGDFFLLMSDGIVGTFSEDEIIDDIRTHGIDAATSLVDAAKTDRPGHSGDNVALVVVEIL